jgi:Mn-dependent DtxR family transcriptional regulator
MSSKGAIKWLARLKEPRTIESLISEVYGEATWFGCLFEREVADVLNFYELTNTFHEFNTEDWTLNQLIKQVENRQFLSTEQLSALRDAKNARNELVHRLIAKKLVVSRADKEFFLAEIDALYIRVWRGHRLAVGLKEHLASKLGITKASIQKKVDKLKNEAKIEDENIRKLIGDEPNVA